MLRLRTDAFDAVMKRDMSFFDEFASGKIVSRVTSDTQDFSNIVTLAMNLFSQVLLVVVDHRRALLPQSATDAAGA